MIEPLKVLIIEDEALLAMELESLVEDAGHSVVGWATSSTEAMAMADATEADIVFVDIHLSDGPSGIDVAKYIGERKSSTVVFMTANPKRIPDHFAGAIGVIAKPYTMNGLTSALRYLQEGVRRPPPVSARPAGFTLSPAFETAWAPAA
ncbi:response regulator [Mesorhizobium sp. M7A.F.Ca.CA.001.09.2.1]|uniref:Response regulator n=1 Tax=Mesorhizobium ciceri TaxID=39645 RepID=A0AB38T447_9HYPH|nr:MULTISPECIES: response regulator [Mesorhizobium]RUY55935.1 response regulator [Mesorhizobium sp. M7A.F.Ca.CA.001.13.2.1]MBZ9720712.1 response regulator [Mesorhizobium sp. AD1-1]MDF3212834.1 response regulator [Mesorhizobium ciceri]RUY55893.1 response regulator [Mesorhizobium sp. M7A.F.Ca.CA.001.05.1.1]RUY67081.1 response regulator [Mesorhizobium sp. M7A.F.Ca.CA.001.13.1.1]